MPAVAERLALLGFRFVNHHQHHIFGIVDRKGGQEGVEPHRRGVAAVDHLFGRAGLAADMEALDSSARRPEPLATLSFIRSRMFWLVVGSSTWNRDCFRPLAGPRQECRLDQLAAIHQRRRGPRSAAAWSKHHDQMKS
jgi:hypothetical protein